MSSLQQGELRRGNHSSDGLSQETAATQRQATVRLLHGSSQEIGYIHGLIVLLPVWHLDCSSPVVDGRVADCAVDLAAIT